MEGKNVKGEFISITTCKEYVCNRKGEGGGTSYKYFDKNEFLGFLNYEN